jgi:hypothetical protein
MIFIGIRKRTFGILLAVLILCLLAVTAYAAIKVSHNENKYQSVLAITKMFDDTHFIAYISGSNTEDRSKNIEVFDIVKGEVIISEPSNISIQKEVFNYLKTIKSLYTKVMPFPDKGYVIRVPFNESVRVDQKILNDSGIKSIDSLYIILSDKEAPIILILDSHERPYFYTFNASIQPLLEYVKLNPETESKKESIYDADQRENIIPEEIETYENKEDVTTENEEKSD